MRESLTIEIPQSYLYYNIYTRVRCVNNPGRGGIGMVFLNEDQEKIAEHSKSFERETNNTLEYLALIQALELLNYKRDEKSVLFSLGNEGVIRQRKGINRVDNENLQKLLNSLREEEVGFNNVKYEKASTNEKWSQYAKNLARATFK